MWQGHRYWTVTLAILFLALTDKRAFGEQPGIIHLIIGMPILSPGEMTIIICACIIGLELDQSVTEMR